MVGSRVPVPTRYSLLEAVLLLHFQYLAFTDETKTVVVRAISKSPSTHRNEPVVRHRAAVRSRALMNSLARSSNICSSL
jgi:hypothetical protein